MLRPRIGVRVINVQVGVNNSAGHDDFVGVFLVVHERLHGKTHDRKRRGRTLLLRGVFSGCNVRGFVDGDFDFAPGKRAVGELRVFDGEPGGSADVAVQEKQLEGGSSGSKDA